MLIHFLHYKVFLPRPENLSREEAELLCRIHYSKSLTCFTEVEAILKGPGRISCHLGLAQTTLWLQTVCPFLVLRLPMHSIQRKPLPSGSHRHSASQPSLWLMIIACVCSFCFHSLSYTVCEMRHLSVDLLWT